MHNLYPLKYMKYNIYNGTDQMIKPNHVKLTQNLREYENSLPQTGGSLSIYKAKRRRTPPNLI